METMTVTVKGVNVVVDGKKSRVVLTIDKMVKQFVQERDENGKALGFDTMSEQEAAFVKMPLSKLIAQLREKSEEIDLHIAMLDKLVGKKELVLLLMGSDLTITHQLYVAGDVIGEGDDEYTYEHDTWVSDIKAVKLCERAKSYMEKFMFM